MESNRKLSLSDLFDNDADEQMIIEKQATQNDLVSQVKDDDFQMDLIINQIGEQNEDSSSESEENDKIDENLKQAILADLKKQYVIFQDDKIFWQKDCPTCYETFTINNYTIFQNCAHMLCQDCRNQCKKLQHNLMKNMSQTGQSSICPQCNKIGGRQVQFGYNNFQLSLKNTPLQMTNFLQKTPQVAVGYNYHSQFYNQIFNNEQQIPLSESLPIEEHQEQINEIKVSSQCAFIDIENQTDAVLMIEVRQKTDTNQTGKDYIILLDKSGSMTDNDRISIMKQAIIKILTSKLTINDRATVISFSTESQQLWSLSQASQDNIEKWKRIIDNVYPTGGTHYHEGIKKVIEVIQHSKTTEQNRQCCILIAGDGEDTAFEKDLLNEMIEQVNNQEKCIIYGLSIGNNVEASIFQDLLRENFTNGNYTHFDEFNQNNENVDQKIIDIGFLDSNGVKNLTIDVNNKINTSKGQYDSQTNTHKIITTHFTQGIIRYHVKNVIKQTFKASCTYQNDENNIIDIPVEQVAGNQDLLKQWVQFMRDSTKIFLINNLAELYQLQNEATQENYGANYNDIQQIINTRIANLGEQTYTNSNLQIEQQLRLGKIQSTMSTQQSGFN